LVLPNFVTAESVNELRDEAKKLIDSFDQSNISVFSTKNQEKQTDQYFISSGDKIRFFFEEDAFTDDGKLKQDLGHSINKIGHALHDLNPVFRRFSRQPSLCSLIRQLGHKEPQIAQSMYIFKQPHIGGTVKPHQDNTYLYTEPTSCIGFWFALEDATKTNGCMWAIPGSHKQGIARRFVLTDDGNSVIYKDQTGAQFSESEWALSKFVPLECTKGSLVVLHGNVAHMSYHNSSDMSRHAYTYHILDGTAKYLPDNWLQIGKPFPAMEPIAE